MVDRAQMRKFSDAVARDFSLDLLVRTPAEIARRLRWGDFFLREIMEKGKVLYEAHTASEVRKCFKDCKMIREKARLSLGLPV